MTIDIQLAHERLRFFAESTTSRAPLYSLLSAFAADDPMMLGIVAAGDGRDADAPLLFAAVQHQLRRERGHHLASYYRTLGGFREPDKGAWHAFRDFVSERIEPTRRLLADRYVQANEVQRMGAIYPVLAAVCRSVSEPIALVELGCSAGLLLSPDRYRIRYRFSDGRAEVVQPSAPIGIDCVVDGNGFDVPRTRVDLAERIGLDRRPAGSLPEDLEWLESCIWSDHPDRLTLLRSALKSRVPEVEFVTGDVVADLHRVMQRVPNGRPIVVMTSWLLLYLSECARRSLCVQLTEIAAKRRLWWIDTGPYEELLPMLGAIEGQTSQADLTYRATGYGVVTAIEWEAGEPSPTPIAVTEPHGGSMRWLYETPMFTFRER
ncbi:DUF2332 domain-containing protein [Nocardia salmonicida]|uniref:DUF2332 domain-containing protein n=1 Tax=Nocardia salmonicida TaxID=53431 RepID=UPI0033D93514